MKTLLCFGDSNTWGHATEPRPDGRYAPHERWPGIVRARLAPDWTIVEEGLPGRTTVCDDPIEGAHMNGQRYLHACLRSHRPIDAMVIMLGSNNLKARFGLSAFDIAESVATLIADIPRALAGPGGATPAILIVCPPPLTGMDGRYAAMFAGGHAKSIEMPRFYAEVAERVGARFLDAGTIIRSSDVDGLHLDPDAHAVLGGAIADIVATMA
ncbi:SGNH/GDSL hydrolase family protein [Segnochrobactrum spirostomi]|uniref:SGNH/GDSL hydrolase family protein n=1 Tax=Segnochrobactrum spirostomi TaxID=2608987 RepID=A0A6A7Y6B9_9HYPH|nr:SGNH/GDSL hydrolase family protein [Segnochrobactrum spirostomi]MQT13618.1 SGNH/GDSL hydrolase family protein [Segnochrobactrum spirostomi]